jgi:hypothetical protein
VFENRVLRRIFGPKREEVTGDRRKLHNENVHDLYSSPIISVFKLRSMRWPGHVARTREMRNKYTIFVRKSKGRRTLGSHRRGWEDNIKMDPRE